MLGKTCFSSSRLRIWQRFLLEELKSFPGQDAADSWLIAYAIIWALILLTFRLRAFSFSLNNSFSISPGAEWIIRIDSCKSSKSLINRSSLIFLWALAYTWDSFDSPSGIMLSQSRQYLIWSSTCSSWSIILVASSPSKIIVFYVSSLFSCYLLSISRHLTSNSFSPDSVKTCGGAFAGGY